VPLEVPVITGQQAVASWRAFHARIPWRSLLASWNILSSHDTARIRTVVGSAERQVAALGLAIGLPGVVVHGMWTMGAALRIVTDWVGDPDANKVLSLKRANAVKDALVKLGVAAANITTVGNGETKPIASNSTPAGLEANRRVDITVQ